MVAVSSGKDGRSGGVAAGSSSLQITGGFKKGNMHYGDITISVVTSKDYDLLPVDTQLFSAQTEAYADTMAIGLPAQRNSSFVSAYHVPVAVADGSTLRFVFWLLSNTVISLPAGLKTYVRRFAEPADAEKLDLPVESEVVLNYTSGNVLTAGKYLRVTTELVEVSGGDTVYIRFARAGATDGESAELHVLKQYAKFENE